MIVPIKAAARVGCNRFVCGFSQGLSVMVQYFSLTTNQHQLDLSAQKPISEHAACDSQAYCLAHQCNVIMMMKGMVPCIFFILVKGRPMI